MARVNSITLRGPSGEVLSKQETLPPPIPQPDPPTISEMVGNFGGAMLRWAMAGFATVDEVAFRLRLESCRACAFWDESARGGAGKCNHPKCGCTKAKLWLATERCPITRW